MPLLEVPRRLHAETHMPDRHHQFGLIVLFGSGETSPAGGQVFESVARRLAPPVRAAVLETPAGFQLNSPQVAGRVADFVRVRLQPYAPEVTLVAARKRGTPFSPDDEAIVRPLLDANMIFLGPGSPSYAVRQLHNALAWQLLIARHRLGAAVVLASAATIAASARALPVYEIYNVGADAHWIDGLDFFAAFGLSLVFVPHWNNRAGGAALDTSHCFMGLSRFDALRALLPADVTIVGIDEHTALVIDVEADACAVMGHGGVTVMRSGAEHVCAAPESFPLNWLGACRRPDPAAGVPPAVWQAALWAQAAAAATLEASPDVMGLVEARQAARARRDWPAADVLRQQLAALGWRVLDTPEGSKLEPM